MAPNSHSPEDFVPGQRWLSEAEADLGIGTVTEVDLRIVHLAFPAVGEKRTYARQGAPLARVILTEGDPTEDQQGRSAKVMQAEVRNGLIIYQVSDEEGNSWTMPETELSDNLRLDRPQDKLLAGRIDKNIWFDLRYQSWLKRAEEVTSPAFGLVGPRVSLIPHQLQIAAEVAGRHSPRVLLADEVGLGKTIEAGLILHRMLLAGRVSRILIVVPEALLYQWLVEMLRRFNLRFALFNSDRFASFADEENPFHSEQRILCSLEFLISNPKIARAALDGEWDLLIVDEAHHLTWSPIESSLEYDLIEALAEPAKGVLLLTATPEQLGRSGHFGRLRLLDPARFHDYADFLEEEKQYEPVAALSAKLLDKKRLLKADKTLLTRLLGSTDGKPEELVDRLVDRHGVGRVLFRNTRAAIKGFPERKLLGYSLPLPAEYEGIAPDIHGWRPETEIGPGWTEIDGRVDWLAMLLRQLAPQKVLAICADPKTVLDLREALLSDEGIHAAVFHEGMQIVERDRAAAYFADPKEGAQLMICSEIGSEGRNFQFAHHLVLLDLPLEPELLEQRIGRLDRIGQTEEIKIHIPYFVDSPSELLLRWYRDGLKAIESPAPAAAEVFQQLFGQLQQVLDGKGDVSALLADAKHLTAEIHAELEAGRDRLLELQSHHPERAKALAETIRERDNETGLTDYLTHYWDAYGVQHEPGPGRSTILHPGSHMLHHSFPSLLEDGVTVTFDRSDALAHEDRMFLTWEHPMVQGAMEMLTSDELGSSAFLLMHNPSIKTGTLLLEMVHIAECIAPKELEVVRFLPPTAMRRLLDAKGRDRSQQIGPEKLMGECLTGNRKLAGNIIRSQSDLLRELIKTGNEQAQKEADGLIKQAGNKMKKELTGELERLKELAQVNPNVRKDEIEYLEIEQMLLDQHLKQTKVRLDAVRIIVFA